MLLRDVEVEGARCDVRIAKGLVREIGRLAPAVEEDVVEGRGGALIPGLADHHLHLAAMAMARASVDLSAGLVALRTAEPRHGWIRGIGVQSDALPDRQTLDAIRSDVPIKVQDRGGAVWVLNSRALQLLGRDVPDGRLWRSDQLLHDRVPLPEPDIAALGAELLTMGLTHLTDATPDLEVNWVARLQHAVPQHLLCLGDADGSGPVKLVVPDHELPTLDDLIARIAAVHESGRAVAVHCVTAPALALLLAAGLREGDRIEHASVVPADAIATLRDLGVVVVTQPTLPANRGAAYLRESDPIDVPDLWRHRTLLDGGVATICSSDAPYGDPDPWTTLRAARDRELGPGERVDPATTLRGLWSDPEDLRRLRTVAVGQPADLVLLHAPLTEVLRDPHRDAVRLTVLRGRPSGG